MIARPPRTVPVPDAVASLSGRQLPAHVRDAITEAALCGRLLTSRTHAACPLDVRLEAGGHLHQRIARANRVLAAHNPGLTFGWGDMPGRER
ncbi:hypothetical protein [Streptomyces sp. NPDC050704]|uniref:hypothetical protein n=1 Tax=Streptomyces sp. NPDC050704 TaxID=3157219 RepID=UPI00341E809E